MGFYSTYEELKRRPYTGHGRGHAGFYSTYEELKPSFSVKRPFKAACFYSTYEELKQAVVIRLLFPLIRFLQYLWGIETIQLFYIT